MSMLCNIDPEPWLTFQLEFSSMTHPFGFEDFPAGVSPHIQPVSILVLTLGTSIKLDRKSSLTEENILT